MHATILTGVPSNTPVQNNMILYAVQIIYIVYCDDIYEVSLWR